MNHILSDHNAHIRVEDNSAVGTRFTIEIPAAADAALASECSRPGSCHMKGQRILIVDDEPGIRQSLGGVLEDEGYSVETVETGEAALGILSRDLFDLVFLDIWLPGTDGLEILARIQEIPFAARPQVVMVSGHGSIEAAVRATKLGAFDFLEKPLSLRKADRGHKKRAGTKPAATGKQLPKRRHRFQVPDYRGKRTHESPAPTVGADGGNQWPSIDLWRKRDR